MLAPKLDVRKLQYIIILKLEHLDFQDKPMMVLEAPQMPVAVALTRVAIVI